MNNYIQKIPKKILPKFILKKIEGKQELQKIFFNVNWLLLDKLVNMAVALFVGVWVIRYLGPERYGILSYALAVAGIFGIFLQLGLKNISIRELVNRHERRGEIMGTVFALKVVGALLALTFSISTVFLTKPGDSLTLTIVLIVSLAFIFQPTEIIDSWFQSQVASKYSVYARTSAVVTGALIKIILILLNAPLVFFAWAFLIEVIVLSTGLLAIYLKTKERLSSWSFNFDVAKRLMGDAWPMFLSAVSVVIYMKIDQVMIGNMLDNDKLGQYSAAVKLSEFWYFIPMMISGSVFPAILYAKKTSRETYFKRLQYLYDILVWIAIMIAILATFLSGPVINFLYGQEFPQSASVLAIHIWAGVAIFINVASNKFLIAENLTKISFYKSLVGAIINIILNVLLIPVFGINGAALATLISYVAVVIFLFIPKRSRISAKLFFNSFNIIRIMKYTYKLIK